MSNRWRVKARSRQAPCSEITAEERMARWLSGHRCELCNSEMATAARHARREAYRRARGGVVRSYRRRDHPHGSEKRYDSGCRCHDCKVAEANRELEAMYA